MSYFPYKIKEGFQFVNSKGNLIKVDRDDGDFVRVSSQSWSTNFIRQEKRQILSNLSNGSYRMHFTKDDIKVGLTFKISNSSHRQSTLDRIIERNANRIRFESNGGTQTWTNDFLVEKLNDPNSGYKMIPHLTEFKPEIKVDIFEKDKYYVVIGYKNFINNDNSFPLGFCFKQKVKSNYLSAYKDVNGDENGWRQPICREATGKEAFFYEKMNKPYHTDLAISKRSRRGSTIIESEEEAGMRAEMDRIRRNMETRLNPSLPTLDYGSGSSIGTKKRKQSLKDRTGEKLFVPNPSLIALTNTKDKKDGNEIKLLTDCRTKTKRKNGQIVSGINQRVS